MNFKALNLYKIFFYASAALWTWLVFVFLVTGNTFYEISDNLQIEWLISGAYGKSIHNFPRFFQLYGNPLDFMYKHFPGISWMGFLFIVLNYVSGLCLLWCLVQRTAHYHFRIRLALILVIAAFLTDFILYLDFTRSALLTGMAGVLLFFCSEKYNLKAFALLLIVAAIGLRFMAIYFIGLMTVVWLFYEFKLNRMLIAYGAVLVFSYLSFGIPNQEFSGFIKLNKAKTVFNDYGVNRKNFKEENCFGGWFFLDEKINQKVIDAAQEVKVFSRFSFDKLNGAITEAKGQIQWSIFIILLAIFTKRFSVLILYFLSFIGLVVFLKFSVNVWILTSLFLAFIALLTKHNNQNFNKFNLKWLVSLLLILVLVIVKTTNRINFSRPINAEHLVTINSLNRIQSEKTVYLINFNDFRRFINPFSLKQKDFSNTVFLTGWQTIHPEYKQLINQRLGLDNDFTINNVSDKLRNNYIILKNCNTSEFTSCVNSKLNLKISFVNKEQITDNATPTPLKLFYVH